MADDTRTIVLDSRRLLLPVGAAAAVIVAVLGAAGTLWSTTARIDRRMDQIQASVSQGQVETQLQLERLRSELTTTRHPEVTRLDDRVQRLESRTIDLSATMRMCGCQGPAAASSTQDRRSD